MEKQKWIFPLLLALGLRLILTIWLASTWMVTDRYRQNPTTEYLQKTGWSNISPQSTIVGRAFLDVWLRWDAVQFLNIAKYGYTIQFPNLPISSHAYAYFPAYPLVVRLVTSILPLAPLHMESYAIASLLVSLAATFTAMTAMQKLVLILFQDRMLANWSILLWGTFPTSFFLFAPYSEGLFAAFTLITFIFISKKNWLLAGIFCSLAGFTRSQGILVTLSVGLALLLDVIRQRRFPSLTSIIGLIIAPLGWLSYQLWIPTQVNGNLFNLYNSGWNNRLADPITVFINTLSYDIKVRNTLGFFELLAILVFGSILVWMLTKPLFHNAPELLLYSVTTMGAFIVWDCSGCSGYISSLRYILSVYPVFIGLAWLILRLPARFQGAIVTINTFLLLICSLMYALWVFIA